MLVDILQLWATVGSLLDGQAEQAVMKRQRLRMLKWPVYWMKCWMTVSKGCRSSMGR